MTGGWKRGTTSMLGVSHIQCKSPYCLEWNRTKSKPYSKFDKKDKVIFHGGIILRSIFLGGIFGSIPSMSFLGNIKEYNTRMLVMFGFALIGGFIYYKIAMWLYKKEISKIEEEQKIINEKMESPIFPLSKPEKNDNLLNKFISRLK